MESFETAKVNAKNAKIWRVMIKNAKFGYVFPRTTPILGPPQTPLNTLIAATPLPCRPCLDSELETRNYKKLDATEAILAPRGTLGNPSSRGRLAASCGL
jgi:hypothetical protein